MELRELRGWEGGGACEGKPRNRKRNRGGGVTTQMGRTCADTVKLSHFVGSAGLILMFRRGRVMWECNYFHL